VTILVLGTGIIGTTYGWALAEAGHRVVHLVRPGKAARCAGGIPMDVLDLRKGHRRRFRGPYRLAVTEVVLPSDEFSLVILPTKHYHLKDALERLVPDVGQADFMLLTQNWRGTAEIDPILPHSRYVYGDAKAGGTYSNATLVSALSSIDLGPPDGKPTPLAERCAAPFKSAGIPVGLHKDMLHYLWVQYAISGGLWPALVRAGSMERALRDPRAGEGAMAAVRECLEVVARRGVELRDYPDTRPFLDPSPFRRWLRTWALKLTLRHSEYAKRCSSHGLNDPVEMGVFYEDLVATGRELGVPMPVMNGYAQDIASFVFRKN
jgi:2-dehydropantoate 2-reductase